jgi:hypothetical protein
VEIQNFLNDNKAGGDWKKLSWMRWETVKLIAYEGAGLQIGTKAFFEKIRAAQAAKQNKAQEGF